MCFSVHFRIVSSDKPTNVQMIFLYKNWPTYFNFNGSLLGLYMNRIPIIADKEYRIFLSVYVCSEASVKMYV
jgi:hypothetical protein